MQETFTTVSQHDYGNVLVHAYVVFLMQFFTDIYIHLKNRTEWSLTFFKLR